MLGWVIDKGTLAGRWVGQDIRRLHAVMILLDLIGVSACLDVMRPALLAIFAQPPEPELLQIIRGRSRFLLAGAALPMLHFAITPWGQHWIKRSAQSFSIMFLIVAVGGAFLGMVVTDYARAQAILIGYRSCDQTFLNDFQRKSEILVAPGVLCPPTSSAGKSYPPSG
ncbi:hypothetical protein PSE_1195 [Pseudovibrio sp. FO-BEG1]|uniref:hypothetical protein n=1 Tax=Pseudovibrio sp. (strain FO-BEG1) TaxID=911045 RepID=UPI000238CFC5|nr:hypothetical protein [Pseudovibrio sp. FO-BEG1]AEV35707.1 hypothetical protein PSE_1195 [Pseudovibrio sp. FO-BEG1]